MSADGFLTLDPVVGGQIGENTVLHADHHPPRVEHLHYELDGWPADPLQQSFPCFVVEARLGSALLDAGYGHSIELCDVELGRSPEGVDRFGDFALPTMRWMKVHAAAGHAKVGVTSRARLVVAGEVWVLLQNAGVTRCAVRPYRSETD